MRREGHWLKAAVNTEHQCTLCTSFFSESLNRYYVGHTDDLGRRLEQHNTGRSQYTKGGTPWSMQYVEPYDSRSAAMKREYEIKSRKSRKYINKLIQGRLAQLV